MTYAQVERDTYMSIRIENFTKEHIDELLLLRRNLDNRSPTHIIGRLMSSILGICKIVSKIADFQSLLFHYLHIKKIESLEG